MPRSPSSSTASYKIGFIYPRTGALGAYGAEEIQGFKLGLQYATKGTNKVNGKTLDITYVDDKGDAATGVTAAKDLIGQGTKILMGTGSSGVAVQIAPLAAQNQVLYISGPAAADAITGINKYTFRAGRQTIQDVLAAKSYLGKASGKKVVVFDQDSVFGHGNYAAVKAFFNGHNVTEISVPLSRDRLHAVRPAGEEREPRPALHRLGRHDGRRDVQDARSAGSLRPGRRS